MATGESAGVRFENAMMGGGRTSVKRPGQAAGRVRTDGHFFAVRTSESLGPGHFAWIALALEALLTLWSAEAEGLGIVANTQ